VQGTLQRTLTAAIAVPVVLAAIFYLPSIWFFVLLLIVVEVQVYEFVRVSRAWAPHAPLEALLVLVPPTALLLSSGAFGLVPGEIPWEYLLVVQMLLSVGVGSLVLLGRTPVEESMGAIGVFGFGMAYFALPIASMYRMHRLDPWVLLLLLLIIWVSDSAAYFIGRRWGKHKLAKVVSPKKSWEGAFAGLAGAMIVGALWSALRLGEVSWTVVGIAAVTSIGGQIGDLVESMLKRGAGVKDSGSILPGHGGMLDRMDALMFGAPVMLVCLWAAGYDAVVP
jgi:phosphatidate cytidylyltransferase